MDELRSLAILILGGLSLRFALTISGQAWAKSHAQTVAFMILPVITYVITNVMRYVNPNGNPISSAKPHPQPPYQASVWSYG